MKTPRPGRMKGVRVIFCKGCKKRLAGKPGKTITCSGCGKSQTVVRAAALPRRKTQMYL